MSLAETQPTGLARRAVGLFGLSAIAMMALTDLALALALDEKSIFTTTISDLAAGEHSLWQDLSLCAVASSMVSTGVVLLRLLNKLAHKAGAGLLISVGVAIMVLALHNEYGDQEQGGVQIHLELVGYVGVGLALAMCLLAGGLRRFDYRLTGFSYIAAALWFVTGVTFFSVPTTIDGLIERAAAVIALLWLGSICYAFISVDDADPQASG